MALDQVQRDELTAQGWLLLKSHDCDLDTAEVAHSTGRVLDLAEVLPQSGIPSIQRLVPRRIEDGATNMYSGNFGLEPFPLHTDLAHWIQPPRYMILRCLVGAPSVSTRLLHSRTLIGHLSLSAVKRAVFRPRRKSRSGKTLPLSLLQRHKESGELFRWDSLFIEPANRAAEQIADERSQLHESAELIKTV